MGGPLLPYADGVDRLRLLFLLASGPDVRALALIGHDRNEAESIASGWSSRCETVICADRPDTLEAGRYDAVFMLGAGSSRCHGAFEHQLLAASRALGRGGLLVGYVFQSWSLHGLKGLLRKASDGPCGVASAGALQRTLRRAGLVAPQTYYVEPSIASPMALVPTDGSIATRHFQRTVGRNQPLYGPWGYAVRWSVARLGLGGSLQPHLFFWARTPC